jgi:type I restriction enzyme R subunit
LIDAALSLSIFTLISSHVFSLNLFQKSNRIPIAVFDLLCDSKNDLDTKTRNRIKDIAKSLIEKVKLKLQELENWRDKESTKATIKNFIYDYLWSDETGLPDDAYDYSDVDNLSNVVFLHVYQQYASANHHPYAA